MASGGKLSTGGSRVVVEIGNDWLKVLQVDKSKDGATVPRIHLERLETIDNDLSENLSSVIKRQKFANVPVIACLPRQAVNIRMLDLPSEDDDEIADMVELQIGKQTPYSRDEIASGYRTLECEEFRGRHQNLPVLNVTLFTERITSSRWVSLLALRSGPPPAAAQRTRLGRAGRRRHRLNDALDPAAP